MIACRELKVFTSTNFLGFFLIGELWYETVPFVHSLDWVEGNLCSLLTCLYPGYTREGDTDTLGRDIVMNLNDLCSGSLRIEEWKLVLQVSARHETVSNP